MRIERMIDFAGIVLITEGTPGRTRRVALSPGSIMCETPHSDEEAAMEAEFPDDETLCKLIRGDRGWELWALAKRGARE